MIYTNNIINSYRDIIDSKTLDKIKILYNNFTKNLNIEYLIPIFFAHKIADAVSTIELILIKGQVLDNPKKRYVFIESCIYDKNNPNKTHLNPNINFFNLNKIYCPQPPYLNFHKLLLD